MGSSILLPIICQYRSYVIVQYHLMSFAVVHYCLLLFAIVQYHSLSFTIVHYRSISFIMVQYRSISLVIVRCRFLLFAVVHYRLLLFFSLSSSFVRSFVTTSLIGGGINLFRAVSRQKSPFKFSRKHHLYIFQLSINMFSCLSSLLSFSSSALSV